MKDFLTSGNELMLEAQGDGADIPGSEEMTG
jgi:hypothetical protein